MSPPGQYGLGCGRLLVEGVSSSDSTICDFMGNERECLRRYVDGSGALSFPHKTVGGELFRIFGFNFGRIDLTRDVRAWYGAPHALMHVSCQRSVSS